MAMGIAMMCPGAVATVDDATPAADQSAADGCGFARRHRHARRHLPGHRR
ncbi:hypothetical protein [Bifidobacterium cuniculi]|nr:hypothetical protein [Bifidobacterium cuniculi]